MPQLLQHPLLASYYLPSPVCAAADPIDPPTQAALMMALLGFVVLGFGLIMVIMLGARYVRRLNRERPAPYDESNLTPEQQAQAERLREARFQSSSNANLTSHNAEESTGSDPTATSETRLSSSPQDETTAD